MSLRFKMFLTLTLILTVAASSAITTMLVLGRAASAATSPEKAVSDDPVRDAKLNNLISHITIDSAGNVSISGMAISVKAQSAATLSGGSSVTVTGAQTAINGSAFTTIKGGLVKIN